MSDSKKIIFITGTSKGLGLAVAKILLEANYAVVGISRTETIIENPDFAHETFDLNETDAIHGFVSMLIKKYGIPYGLINNAGIGIMVLWEHSMRQK